MSTTAKAPTISAAAASSPAAAPASFRQLLAQWREENAAYASSDKREPAPSWWLAVEAMIDGACDHPSIVQAHYSTGLVHLIDAYLEFLPKVQTGLLPERPTGHIMRSLGELELADRAGPQIKRGTEPIEELRKLDPPIQPDQVSKMYGITIGQAAQFLAGKWAPPPGHVTPEESARASDALALAKSLKEAFTRWQERANAAINEDDWKPPRESIEELLDLPGMTVEQVATMHRVPIEQVQAIQGGKSYTPPAGASTTPTGELTAEALEAEVLAIYKSDPDLKPGEIAEVVGNGMTPQRVGKIIAAVERGA
jgi:hypothetical protein